MIGIRPLLIASLYLLATPLVRASEIPIVFTIVDSERTKSLSYSTGDTSQQVIRHTGTIAAELSFDPSIQRPTAIRFTGADITESPSTFRNTANIVFPRVGSKKVTFEISTSGLRMRLNTLGSAHPVTPGGQILDSHRLQSFPTAGILTTKVTIDGRTQTQQINVANNPPDSVENAEGSEQSLLVVEKARYESVSDFEITLLSSVNDHEVQQLPDNNGHLTLSDEGYTQAQATFRAPNPFGLWLLENGYSLQDVNATSQQGVPLALLFAFDLNADNCEGIPWSFSEEHESLILTLSLPEQGLRRAIRVETCDDLNTGHWETLEDTAFLDGSPNLALGATGNRRILFSDTTSRFYRIAPRSVTH